MALLDTGPNRSALLSQLLRDNKPRPVQSIGEGLANTGSRLLEAAVLKRAQNEQIGQQKELQLSLAQALAGDEEAIASVTSQNPSLGLALLEQRGRTATAEQRADTAKNSVFDLTLTPEQVAEKGFQAGTVVAANSLGELKVQQSPARKNALVDVNVGGKKGEEKLAENAAAQFGAIREGASAARTGLLNASEVESRLNALVGGTLDTGALTPIKKDFIAFAEASGFDTGLLDQIANAEDFEALSNQLTLGATAQLKGAISNKELDFVKETVTSLGKTELGNRFIVKRLKDKPLSDIIRNDIADEVRLSGSKNPLDVQLSRVNREVNNLPTVSKKLKDENGLPVFFTEFYQAAKEIDPSLTAKDIAKQFKELERGSN